MEYQDLNDYELLSYVSENIEEANDIIMEKYYPLVTSISNKMNKYINNCGVDRVVETEACYQQCGTTHYTECCHNEALHISEYVSEGYLPGEVESCPDEGEVFQENLLA